MAATEEAEPDFATGSDPFQYPCRYDFTPFLFIIDLHTAEIIYRQTDDRGFPIDDILDLLDGANR